METLRELDRSVFLFLNGTIHQDWLNPLFWLITTTGLGHVQILLAAPILRWKELRPLFLKMVFAILLGLIVHIPKRMIPRDRPSNWDQAIVSPDELIFGHSFPSGHTMTSFAVATVIAHFAWKMERKWVAFVIFGWAILVGLSRIYRGVHWPSDVLAGAFLGIAVGAIVNWIFAISSRKSTMTLPQS